MNDTLFLTPHEHAQLDQLSVKVPADWAVTDEASTAYESDEQLEIRAQIASFKDDPAVLALVETLKAGKTPAEWPEVPNEILPEVYFTIGARGLTGMIGALLESAADLDDIAMLSALTTLRHEVLMTNESVSETPPSPL